MRFSSLSARAFLLCAWLSCGLTARAQQAASTPVTPSVAATPAVSITPVPPTPAPDDSNSAPLDSTAAANERSNNITPAAQPTRTPNAAAPNTPPNRNATATPATTPTPASTPTPTPGPLPARGTYTVTGTSASLSVFAVSVDAPELLTAIASKANLRLVVDDTVSRKLTVNILNRPARDIVQQIAGAYGLSAADVDGVTMVSEGIPRSPSSYLLSDIASIPTKYVDAANARNLLPVFLQDYVKVNSDQNAVVLSAPREVLDKFRQDIAQFDIPASQILVDLLLVELTDTTLDQLNLDLSYQNGGKGFDLSPGRGSLSFRALTTLPQRFFVDLRALQEKGRARVRANPRIATVSGRRASIFVGRQRYVVTPIDTGNGQRNFIDAGVRLGITPFTGGQQQVLIDMDAEVSTLSAVDPVTRLPEKSTRTVDTVVRVNDGQTIVIGGLMQQESRDVQTKVPILGNLPILGPLLFRTKDSRTTNSELVLFITPRILSDTGHLSPAEELALKQRFLGANLEAASPSAPLVTPPTAPK